MTFDPKHNSRTITDGSDRAAARSYFYSIGLTNAGVPFALFLGVFGGAASSVPYIGILLTALPAAMLCIVQHAGAAGTGPRRAPAERRGRSPTAAAQ